MMAHQAGMQRREQDPYPEGIEIRHLRYFLTSAELGSFRKAAGVLGVQQSAISRRVRDLEDRLGASLFHRHSCGVSLTYAGNRFLRRARQIIRYLNESKHDIASAGRSEHGCVRIGVYSSIASGFLAELLQTYCDQHSRVRIELVDGSPGEHGAAIRQFMLDVAFLAEKHAWPEFDKATLWSEGVFTALPDRHKLAARQALAWHDLRGETFVVSEAAPGQQIREHLVQKLADLDRHPEIQVQSVGRDNLLPLVAVQRGLTLVSEAMTATMFPGIVYRPIIGERISFSAVWSPRNDNPAFRRLLSLAKAMAVKREPSAPAQSAALSQTRDPWR